MFHIPSFLDAVIAKSAAKQMLAQGLGHGLALLARLATIIQRHAARLRPLPHLKHLSAQGETRQGNQETETTRLLEVHVNLRSCAVKVRLW